MAEALFPRKTQAQKMSKGAVKDAGNAQPQRPASKVLNNLFSNYIDDKVGPAVGQGGKPPSEDEYDVNNPDMSSARRRKRKRTKSAVRRQKPSAPGAQQRPFSPPTQQ